MRGEPAGCQCPCDICLAPCERPATQEDLLCDTCRPECFTWHHGDGPIREAMDQRMTEFLTAHPLEVGPL